MIFGRPRGEPSGQMLDLDLLPQIQVERKLFSTEYLYGAGVAIAVLGLIFLALGKFDSRAELQDLSKELVDLEAKSERAIVPKEAQDLQANLDAIRKRAQGLTKDSRDLEARHWPWGAIIQVVEAAKPGGVVLTAMSQREANTLVLQGITPTANLSAVVGYAGFLRDSNLFSSVSVESITTDFVPPEANPFIAVPISQPSQNGFPVTQPIAIPTPSFDYVALSTERKPLPRGEPTNLVTGKVIDFNGAPVTGLTFRISSCCPLWSAQQSQGFDGASSSGFSFSVGGGVFTVEILNAPSGRAQAATSLTTSDLGSGDRVEWNVVFQKVTAGPVISPQSGIIPPTPTFVPTPSSAPAPGGTSKGAATPVATSTPAPIPTSTPSPTPTRIPIPTPALGLGGQSDTSPFSSLIPRPTAVPAADNLLEVNRFTIILTLKEGGV